MRLRARRSLRRPRRECASFGVLSVKLSALLSRHRGFERPGGEDAAATTTAVLFAERAARSASVATSSLGEPAPFSGMVSQPCLGAD